ncbi:RNA polymerase sigma factor [Paludibaculum fermentans]|uniref:RNA polymerase sigma factor n=1 Tax=Paludibaculum fermentans TaxID=1473598 RepID=UPI003EBCE2CC
MQRYSSEGTRKEPDDETAPSGLSAVPAAEAQRTEGETPEFGGARWTALVERIQNSDNSAMEELYRIFSRGVRYYLCRHLGPQELDDKVHDTFLIVVQAIQSGGLREPERLMGFVRTVVRRQVAAFIDCAVQSRREFADMEMGGRVPDIRQNPEQRAIQDEKMALMVRVLRGISRRDREILTRFYLYEQPQEQICEEMSLSETQFRLLKSRAKARFGEMGRRRLSHTGLTEKVLRRASGG